MPAAIRVDLLITAIVTLPLLAACGGGKLSCEDSKEPYLRARSNGTLQIPEGLTKPDGSASLAIPDVKNNGGMSQAGCLAEPPSYFRSSGMVARSPEEVVASWAQAWANREADAVISLYSTGFVAPTDTAGSAAWLEQRREQVATGPVPDPMIENLKVDQDGSDKRVVRFVQKFGSNSLRKELTLVRESSSWRIVAEKVVDVK